MNRIVVLICCMLLLLTSCMSDPYSDQRPADYGEAKWVCDDYNFWFCVDYEKDDYYDPEGELQIGDNRYFCKFYFIHQTNQLHISVYPIKYATVSYESLDREAMICSIEGDCDFSNDKFTFYINKVSGDISGFDVKETTFRRTEAPGE